MDFWEIRAMDLLIFIVFIYVLVGLLVLKKMLTEYIDRLKTIEESDMEKKDLVNYSKFGHENDN